jgi:hypothetical protein
LYYGETQGRKKEIKKGIRCKIHVKNDSNRRVICKLRFNKQTQEKKKERNKERKEVDAKDLSKMIQIEE